jgi:hypothetical protein
MLRILSTPPNLYTAEFQLANQTKADRATPAEGKRDLDLSMRQYFMMHNLGIRQKWPSRVARPPCLTVTTPRDLL